MQFLFRDDYPGRLTLGGFPESHLSWEALKDRYAAWHSHLSRGRLKDRYAVWHSHLSRGGLKDKYAARHSHLVASREMKNGEGNEKTVK
jgi:hypothetical protein